MVLNWNPLSILFLISGIITFISAFITFITPKTKKLRSLLYIKFALIFLAITLFFDAFTVLFMNMTIYRISVLLIIPTTICFSIGINYTLKETYLSIHLIAILCSGVLLCFLALQLESGEQIVLYGSLSNLELFWFLQEALTIFLAFIIFYWGLKTWKNAPFLIKKDATIFFIGIILSTIFPSLTIFIENENYLLGNILCYSFLNIGLIIFIYAIIKEPKLLYILPFTVYRILVKDKYGYLLFDHDWSDSDISEVMFTGFINAVQFMSEEVMNIGGLVDINLKQGMLILHESKTITVGLVTSKSSKLLRDTLVNFSEDFEQQFERQLKQKINDKSEYDPAYLLIDKHFSNFPFRLIKSKKHPLLLSRKPPKIPFELENKLKEIISDEKEYNSIIADIAKSPAGISEDFINLYEDLKKEKDHLPDNEVNEFNNK
ncbi:MAG: hypothetical protein EU532_14945 [Promethearchaeota archaeon]|nr:MAG: hypothetical protein EU532_14945 [Candidatus Lokiarchaeota archaeon]